MLSEKTASAGRLGAFFCFLELVINIVEMLARGMLIFQLAEPQVTYFVSETSFGDCLFASLFLPAFAGAVG